MLNVQTEKIKNIKQHIEEHSQKTSFYCNNLDKLLNIKTVNTCRKGIKFKPECRSLICGDCIYSSYKTKELLLKTNKDNIDELIINSQNFDWYITNKEKDLGLFTVIGLNKKDSNKSVTYKLGKSSNNSKTILEKEYEDNTNIITLNV